MDRGAGFFAIEDLTPHGFCLLWDPALIWTYILSDATIAIAYFSIPAALWVIARRRPDLNKHKVLAAFAAFIVMCGLTHVMAIVTMWVPLYGLSGVIKAITALVSIVTAALIWKVLQPILDSPRADALADANAKLVGLNTTLEARVQERTKALQSTNEQLLRAAIEAREGERVKHDFLSRVSHELRTPLNAIIGFTDLMRTGIAGPLSERQADYCNNVHGAAMHLLEEINDVLDLERLSDPSQRLTLEQIELKPEVERVVQLNQTASGGQRAGVRINIPEAFKILADRRSIVTVLSNLVSNAIKYSPKGGTIDITTRVIAASHRVEIEVRDQGVGIPEEQLDTIFSPFVRVHEADLPTVGGTGLGLSIVRMLTEMHGGQVCAKSDTGSGTTIILSLPIDPAPFIATAVGPDIRELERSAIDRPVAQSIGMMQAPASGI
jgi:signal transduction histidine kinase